MEWERVKKTHIYKDVPYRNFVNLAHRPTEGGIMSCYIFNHVYNYASSYRYNSVYRIKFVEQLGGL